MPRFVLCFALVALILDSPATSAPTSEPTGFGPSTIPIPRNQYAAIHHISPTGSDTSGDGSPLKPWASLRHALGQINDAGDARRYALAIAAGTYAESPITVKSHVDLYGGFDPVNWQRDIARHPTTLDARQSSRVLIAASHSRLDGFTLRNGKIRAPGGAILCDRASPTLSNNTIIHNQTLEPEGYVHELLHQVGHDGGAIACLNGASPLITNNLIAHNSTGVGGGAGIASLNHSAPTILHNVISDNISGTTDKNRSRSSNGAAISCSNMPVRRENRQTIRPRISHNLILNNHALGNSDAGGIYCEYDAHPEISHNLILGNHAEDDGAAIYVMKSSEPIISANIIAGSKAGSALRLSKEGRAHIENNIIFANDCTAIACVGSWMRLSHNIIVANTGRGLAYENASAHLKHSVVSANLFHANTVAQISESPQGSLTFTHNVLPGGHAGEGNINVEPLFEQDAITGALKNPSIDPQHTQTIFEFDGPIAAAANSLTGRPILVNGRWGVIASVEGTKVTIWGDLLSNSHDKPVRFQIPPTYRLRADSPGIDRFGRDR